MLNIYWIFCNPLGAGLLLLLLLIFIVVLVSAVQQSESAVCIHISPLF